MFLRVPDRIEILKCWFLRRRIKPEYQEKILSEQKWEPTTNSTHIWRRRRETNPRHTGGWRVLSSLGHPCSTPSPHLPVLTFVLRSLGNASHAGYVFAVCRPTWKIHRCEIKSPYFLGWLKGYGPRLGTTNGSTRSSCFESFGSSSSCFRFLLSGDSGNVILKGDEKIRYCSSANKFPGMIFQSEMLKCNSPGILGTILLTENMGSI